VKTTPTQRSLTLLRKQGWTCGVVEKWNAHVGIRQDFCGGIDLIAFSQGGGVLGVQCCAGSGLASHRTKLLAEPRMREWVAAGARLVIYAWRKTNDRKTGKRKLWNLNEVELALADFPVATCVEEAIDVA
jgi:hypothetical protein